MHLGRGNLPGFAEQSGVEQFIAFAVFWLVAIGAGLAQNALTPGMGLAGLVVLSGLCGALGSFLAAKAMQNVHDQRRDDAETEYRDMIEAEKQKKIDAMRRANSRVPDVPRPARKGE